MSLIESPLPGLAAALVSLTALYLLATIVTLARRRDDYSHLRHTLSELGEVGSPTAKAAAWISFAPTGLLVGASLFVLRPSLPADEEITRGLLFFGMVGLGYLLAAFFPCDAGAPMLGSPRNQIHNLVGAMEYLGALGGLDILRRALEDIQPWQPLAKASQVAFVLVLLGFIGTAMPNPFRGLAQRIGEVAIFGWLLFAGWSALLLPL